MKLGKKALISILAVILFLALAAAALFIPFEYTGNEPYLTIACFSDPHHEYGVQDTDSHVRPSTEKAVELVKSLGGADIVFLGGDITGRNGNWDEGTVKATVDASYKIFESASVDGKVLVVTGNHDPEPTVHGGVTDFNSNDYSGYMKDRLGDFVSAYYTSDLDNEFAGPFEELLCYRYKIDGINFIGLNTPYGDRREVKQTGYNGLYCEQVEWLQSELESIGKDETVFVLCHYPVHLLHTVEVATLKVDTSDYNASRELMDEILSEYENVVYCYGHVHTENVEAFINTSETVTSYTASGGATYCHMGSLGYYNDHFGGPLGFEDPKVIQVNMISVYADRIEFSIKNAGESAPYGGEYEISTYTVPRKMNLKTNLFREIFK